MIHALYTLPALLTRVTGLPPTITLNACLVALLLVSLWVMWRVMRAYQPPQDVSATVLFGMAMASWLMFNTFQWGQREHLFTLFYLPWLVLRLARREDKPIGRGLALTVGLMAGIGLAIKPYFALTGLVVEGIGVLITRRWCIRTPEVLGVLVVAGLHALYFALNPDVLAALLVLIQRLSAGYNVYIAVPWAKQQSMVLLNAVIIAAPFILTMLGYRWRVVPRPLLLALGAMGLGGMVGFLLQRKGWNYHAIPFLTSSLLTGIALAVEGGVGHIPLTDMRRQNLARMVIVAMGVALSVGMALSEVNKVRGLLVGDEDPTTSVLASYIKTYTAEGDNLMFLDTIVNPAYPMLAALNRRNVTRYPMATPFPVAYYHYQGLPYTDPAHVVPVYMQEYLDAVQMNVLTYAPKMVIIRSDRCGSCSDDFPSLYDYLVARGVIDTALTPDYTLVAVDEGFHIYVRNDLVPQP